MFIPTQKYMDTDKLRFCECYVGTRNNRGVSTLPLPSNLQRGLLVGRLPYGSSVPLHLYLVMGNDNVHACTWIWKAHLHPASRRHSRYRPGLPEVAFYR
jgi:hypothetical protein